MDSPELHVEFTRKEDTVSIKYSVRNPTPNELFLFNVLWSYSKQGAVIVDPVGVYVSSHDNAHMRLGQIVHPAPKEKFAEQSLIPFARRLESQESWSETIDIPVPVCERNPYYVENVLTKWEDVSITSAEFWLSYFNITDELQVAETPIEGAYRLSHPKLLASVQTLKSAKMSIDFKGKRRTDRFERF